MKKFIIKGMGNQKGRIFFTVKKNKDFFTNLNHLIKELRLILPKSFYAHLEETKKLSQFTDIQENTKNKDYDLDIIYGKTRIFLIFRTDPKNRKYLINLMLSLSEDVKKTLKPLKPNS